MLSSAWQFWRFSNKTFSCLFIDFEMSEPRCAIVVNSMIIILIISAIVVWIDKSWAICLTLLGALVLLIEASAQSFYPPESSALYNLPCHALRYLLPFGLLLIHHKKYKASETLLAIATGITFFGHGMKALLNELMFQDFILAFFSDIGQPIEFATSLMLLHVIGTIDIALAHHICFFKWRRLKWILRYMAVWGLISAFSRVTYGGWGAWHEVTLRAPHYLVPLALLIYVSKRERSFLEFFKNKLSFN
jgi:hypothetical protein